MWTKNETALESASDSTAGTRPQPQSVSRSKPPASSQSRAATIGPSISIKGDISGNEDLLINGRVQGTIELREYNVTVGSDGRVVADIHAKRICVEGEVTGDLFGDEVLIRKSGRMEGNTSAPKVMLENGCHYRGTIDMTPANGAQRTKSPPTV